MEGNGLPGGMYSSGLGGSLGLELPLQQQQGQAMVAYGYPAAAASYKPKQPSSLSEDDDENDAASDGIGRRNSGSNTKGGGGGGGGGVSPWQRMKWTDSMVRLLIMAVYYIGDEAGSDPVEPTGKRKGGGGGGGAVLSQKKGKWKSVSRAMMEKGFYVSPQQCEDKFNDLNKRYKRVNDILGKGTACRVVEDQSLLDSMNLAPKLKDEVKKLLNSKHLFFREMCAYHNSCGHGPNAEVGTADPSPGQQQAPQPVVVAVQQQQQRCSHSSDSRVVAFGLGAKRGRHQDEEEEDEDDDESDKDDDYDAEDEDDVEGNFRGGEIDDDKDGNKQHSSGRVDISSSSMLLQLNGELASVMQDEGKSPWEKKQWMDLRLTQLEEQQLGHQLQSYELEKQRLKWAKFTGKKEREMERAKLENERRRLENERMMLLLRKKELELLHLHHHLSATRRAGDPSSVTN